MQFNKAQSSLFISENYCSTNRPGNRSSRNVTGRPAAAHPSRQPSKPITMHLCFVTLDWRNLPLPPPSRSGLGSWLLIALMSDIDLMSSTAVMHYGRNCTTRLFASKTVQCNSGTRSGATPNGGHSSVGRSHTLTYCVFHLLVARLTTLPTAQTKHPQVAEE
jgi:hypothetical protein